MRPSTLSPHMERGLYTLDGPALKRLSGPLVPSCFAIFDLEPLSSSFDFVFVSEIFKSLSFRLDPSLTPLRSLCLDQNMLSLCIILKDCNNLLDRLDNLEAIIVYHDVCAKFEHEHVVMNPTSAGIRHHHLHLYVNPEIKQLAIKHVDEYGFVIRLAKFGLGLNLVRCRQRLKADKTNLAEAHVRGVLVDAGPV
ncbi:hypothetical protein Tco_0706170 [Tanacetum coccineum]|uniref:Uncharacterized protein n=1 Tax=Tanacetum coccineum TaxID=301880 RepID=A0ABQ4Y6M5_9ASTR